MPRSVSLAFYAIRVREKRTNNSLPLGSIEPGEDFFNFLESEIASLSKKQVCNKEDEKFLSLKGMEVSKTRREIKGSFLTGDFGFKSQLVDSRNGEPKFVREIEHAELIPLYFLATIPKNSDRGIMVFQRFSQSGVYSILRTELARRFSAKYPDLILEFNGLTTSKLMKIAVNDGQVRSLKFDQFGIGKDIADSLGLPTEIAKTSHISFIVKAKRGGILPFNRKLETLLEREKGHARKLIEITNINYNKVTAEMVINGKTRKVSVEKGEAFRPYIEISGDVKFGNDGHPLESSVDLIAHELLAHFLDPQSNA